MPHLDAAVDASATNFTVSGCALAYDNGDYRSAKLQRIATAVENKETHQNGNSQRARKLNRAEEEAERSGKSRIVALI